MKLIKLGTKVKCKGYLEKLKTIHMESAYAEKISLHAQHFSFKKIEDDDSQPIRKFKHCIFDGIIVAKKRIATTRYYELVGSSWNNEDCQNVRVSNENYIICYQVFFRMGGSRLVPINMCEVNS